jgi:putative acyl-CoA dehydrogenase
VLDDIAAASAGDATLSSMCTRLRNWLGDPQSIEARGRQISEALAVLAAATLLRAYAMPAVADAFIATRIAGEPRQLYGQGIEGADIGGIVDRALPQ